MIVDTSVVIAIALGEPSAGALRYAIGRDPRRIIASVSLLEARIVLRARWGAKAAPLLYDLVDGLGLEVAEFAEAHAKIAIGAVARFGKGMKHRARLNFGDCAVYAVAALSGEPILATGRDFAATDLTLISY